MNYQLDDAITALATPAGVGAISVIRVSGKGTIEKVDRIFSGRIRLVNAESHTVHYGNIIHSNEIIDDVLVSVFRKPNSYTGEDSIEISSHGSPFIVRRIIKLLLQNEIRLAEPGEFTKRAFINGKLDLSQAEAVADIINSRTEASLKGARNQMTGALSDKIDELRKKLIDLSSMLELELDFAEEDVEFLNASEVKERIDSVSAEIQNLMRTYSYGRVIRDGVNVALVGRPNVGKSSVLNYILKEARAIVSEIPGTTRDVIREELSINGILYKFHDTAGIRIADNVIEKEGVLRSREAVKNADIAVYISDPQTDRTSELEAELRKLAGMERIISVMNKIDLDKTAGKDFDVQISALTGEGMKDLFSALEEKTFQGKIYSENSAIVTNIRHFQALEKAKGNLDSALETIKAGLTGEFISVGIREASNSLGEIIGEITSDDILNNIFSNFCIGK